MYNSLCKSLIIQNPLFSKTSKNLYLALYVEMDCVINTQLSPIPYCSVDNLR